MNGEQSCALSLPLPEDIQKRKWAGDLTGAAEAITRRLKKNLPKDLRDRLELELEILKRLPTQYPYNKAQALAVMRESIGDFTEEELDALDLDGCVDWINTNAGKRYFVRFHMTLLKTPALALRAGNSVTPDSEWLDPLIERIINEGELTAHIVARAELRVSDDAFIPGETYRAHLPIPADAPQTRDIHLVFPGFKPRMTGGQGDRQRTAFFEETLTENAAFTCQYRFTQIARYADIMGLPPAEALYPGAPPPEPCDLAEEGACFRFTPYLRELCRDVTSGCRTPADKVRAIYDFVTMHVTYAFVRDYLQIPDLAEYAAINLRGDCGIQAILFIALCRIAGIPARWQSGAVVAKDFVGSHDWAQFYLEGWGWLFADCSFGGSAYRSGNEKRRLFYLGNLEPLRLVFNRACQKPLTPDKHFPRIDPYDNQTGEIECGAKGFNGRETDGDTTLVQLRYDGTDGEDAG